MYHDTLLAQVARDNPKFKPLLPPSPHTRYTRAWCEKDSTYKWASRLLELVRFTELVVEMGLRRKVSHKNRWRGIVLLEVMKSVFFLHTLKIPSNRAVLQSDAPVCSDETDSSTIAHPTNP